MPSWDESSAKLLYYNPLCHDCYRWRGTETLATVPYHIIPKEKGGTDWWENLMPLCDSCVKLRDEGFSYEGMPVLGNTNRNTYQKEYRQAHPVAW